MEDIYKMRWTAEECPYPLPKGRRRKKEIVHPVVMSWEMFEESDKLILFKIKQTIQRCLENCRVFVFGSRIKGTWDEDSDYDILVLSEELDSDIINKVKNEKFDVLVDLQFSKTPQYIGTFNIEIP